MLILTSYLLFHRRARVTFDTSATQKVFGPIVIDYHQVRPYSFFFFFFFFFQFTLSDTVGGGGSKEKSLPWGGYGKFLELHNDKLL